MKIVAGLVLLSLVASATANSFDLVQLAARSLTGRQDIEYPPGFIDFKPETECLYVDAFDDAACESQVFGLKIGQSEEDAACLGINVKELIDELGSSVPGDAGLDQALAFIGEEVSVAVWIAADGQLGFNIHLQVGDCSNDPFDITAFGGQMPEIPKLTKIPPPMCAPLNVANSLPAGTTPIDVPQIESVTINGSTVRSVKIVQEECRPEGIFSSAAGIIGVSAAGAVVLGLGGFAAYKTVNRTPSSDSSMVGRKPEDDMSTMGEGEDLPPKY
eukprot:TRINITY_DN29707_c0_g1_i1.p1 TRINITY_DN29707_c0_g1~~TRINITY_DN29707_c0_g1_i1.p1  ORF type:complete len:294 (-),score=40.08 TRINITY_DN29707_c0_g1_i1:97-915(-)